MLYAPGDILDSVVAAHQQRWTHTDELLALMLERIDALVDMTGRAWYKTKRGPEKPFRYPRPTQPRRERRPATVAEMYRFFRG